MAQRRQSRFRIRQLLGAGALGLALLTGCHKSPAKLAEVRSLPWETQKRFVKLGRAVRSMSCLQHVRWNDSEDECRKAIESNQRLSGLITDLMRHLPPQSFPQLIRFMIEAEALDEDLESLAESVEDAEEPADTAELKSFSAEIGKTAADLARRMDAALLLDAPEWGPIEGLNLPAPREAKPSTPVVEKKNAPTPAPTTTEAVASPSPTPSVVPASATPAPAPANAAVTGDEAAPAAPSKPPGRVVAASALLAPLTSSVQLIEKAAHEPGPLLETASKSREQLERLVPDLQAYRAMPRLEGEQQKGTRFADNIDQLRGRLMRLSTSYSAAARRVIAGTADELVYHEADGLFEQLKEDLRLLQERKPADP